MNGVYRTDVAPPAQPERLPWRVAGLLIGVTTGCIVEMVALPFIGVFVAFLSLPLFWMADLWRPALLFGGSLDDSRAVLVAADVLVASVLASGIAALVAQDLVGDDGLIARVTPFGVTAAQTAALLALVLSARSTFDPLFVAMLILALAAGARFGARLSQRWQAPMV